MCWAGSSESPELPLPIVFILGRLHLANVMFNAIMLPMRNLIIALGAVFCLILNPAFGQTELFVNGGFESSSATISPWQIVPAPSADLNVLSAAGAYGGSDECLLLAGGNNYSQDVYQTITFPSNLISATLSFHYNVFTTDANTSLDATLYIQLKDSSQNILDQGGPVSNLTPTSGYTPFTARIATVAGSKYAGKTVTFHFVAATANVFAAYTQFFIDNVSMQIATTADIPANDNFTNRSVITGASATIFANNNFAFKETGEPNHASNIGGHSLWWSWIAPSNGIVALKATGVSFQPLLAAYTGNVLNQLTQVAANTANPAQISFKATAGTQYNFAVDGYGGLTGGITLALGFASDVTPPTVTVIAPVIGASVTNPFVLIKGTAGDNITVAQVQYRLENSSGTNDYQTATGTNNWSATVNDLIPGPNTVRIRALDTSSNYSATVTRTLNYLVGSPITLNLGGSGSISGASNGQLLNLGNTYKLAATPAPGFAFASWTYENGSIATNKPVLTFQMATGLSFTANFVDITKPTVSITNLPISGKVSNDVFTVKGKAGDNVAVTNVFYSLNKTIWNTAKSDNNWSNWFVDLGLNPGTNSISTYAVDIAGNISLTNTAKLVYVVSAQLTVSTNGKGSINPALNGSLLQIGKNYTLIAAPAVGFAFANWQDVNDIIITTKPALTFTMASNLSFTANFVDTSKPTVRIINIPVSGKVSNDTFRVEGKAADNVGVANLFYNFNYSTWDGVNTGDGWANWFVDVTLIPGTNTIGTYAVDAAGNFSVTNTVKIVYVLSSLLTVNTNGKGSISPALNGSLLQIGKNYTLTATPMMGFAFTNWTDAGGAIVANKPVLTFLMASNSVFTANFVDVQKPTLTITNITVGQHWSNSVFTVKGTAADNTAVAGVFYHLNLDDWALAGPVTNWSAWSASLNLIPGTNTISAYAKDDAGNISNTNTFKIVYVVSAIVNVQIVTGGLVTPNYDGQSLALGGNYSMKAVSTNGFFFSYWSGDVPMTTNRSVNFNLASNMTLIASFNDVLRPTNAITFPTVNQKLSSQYIMATGKASDNGQIADVWVQINHGGWAEAVSTDGFTNWTSTNLLVGLDTNLLESFAVDAAGNFSATNRLVFQGFFPNSGMTNIPAAVYTIGDRLNDHDSFDPNDNSPTNIIVSRFLMDTNLVSYSQWVFVYNWATNHGFHFDHTGAGKAEDHPVQSVNWYDCVKWCNARSVKMGLVPVYYTDTNLTKVYTNLNLNAVYPNWTANGYRLPTEAEWETAARGGLTSQRFPFGDSIYWNYANFSGKSATLDANGFFYDATTALGYDPDFNDGTFPYTSPVGVFVPNGYSLNDMAGNVSQWCWDWYGTPYGQPTTNNPTGPEIGLNRVVRGGSWSATANEARCAYRGNKPPTFSGYNNGFRCVRRE